MVNETFYGYEPITSINTYPEMYIEGDDEPTQEEVDYALELMGEEDVIEEYIDYPEFMGGPFKRWIQRRKRRLFKLRDKMKNMSPRDRRKLRRKVRRAAIKGALTRLIPGRRLRRIVRAVRLKRMIKGQKGLPESLFSRFRSRMKSRSQNRDQALEMEPQVAQQSVEPQYYDDPRNAQALQQPVIQPLQPIPQQTALPVVISDKKEFDQDKIKKMLPLIIGGGVVIAVLTMKKK
ncbi:hypothetical protein GQ473_06055 [archaeon]|nr:hypothetical protein [archaeon]